MNKTILLIGFILMMTCFTLKGQVGIAYKIDTTKQKNLSLCNFVINYMKKDTINNEFWHPKYKNSEAYDYNIDWVWNEYTPKKLSEKCNIEIIELQQINDSLAYFKLQISNKPNKNEEPFTNIYKYYIVELAGKYYMDNCKDYDSKKFAYYKTKNIGFYTSCFYKIDKQKMENASKSIDSLYSALKVKKSKKAIDYFMCASEEELNNLANIVVWNGGLSGFTNIPEGYVVGINDNPSYRHEFIHAILGYGANCFFLQEGIATLYGGTDKGKISYKKGLIELKECYKKGDCNFDNLYAREVGSKYSSNLTYTFAATFCKYIIDNFGFDLFYKLYYDKNISSTNFIEKLTNSTGKDKETLIKEVEKMILN